jgi:hypothetical protein
VIVYAALPALQLLADSKSFVLYRELEEKATLMRNDFLAALKDKIQRKDGTVVRPPIVPCCNMLAKFLMHADAKDTRINGLLNFEKLETIGMVIREVQRCQQRGRYVGATFHNRSRTNKILAYLESLPHTIEDAEERYR